METLQDLEVEYTTLSTNNKVFSAFLLVLSLSMSFIVNKTILLVHTFPSHQVLGLGQMMANVLMIWIGDKFRLIRIPLLNKRLARHILPLSLTDLGKMVACLGTRGLAFPLVLTPLHQLNVMMTLVLEKYVLGITTSLLVQCSVLAMVEGSLISTIGEPYFWSDYMMVLLRNTFLAAKLVYLKKMLNSEVVGMCGLLYYDSLFRIVLRFIMTWYTNDLARTAEYKDLKNFYFLCHFHMSCVLGLVQSFSVMLCVQYNGALTTAVLDTLTRIVLCYLEILITSPHVIIWTNVFGLGISIFGSLVYTHVTFMPKPANVYLRVDDFKV